MPLVPVSILVPIKNDAANLRRCLPAVCWAAEIWVVDSHSNDDSVPVAEAHGAKVAQFDFNGVWPKKKNWALDTLPFAHDWIFILDADEVLPPSAESEFRDTFYEYLCVLKTAELGGCVQEKLGAWLKPRVPDGTSIYCTGAALAFLTGDQAPIPPVADRLLLGWVFRCLSNPVRFIPRYLAAAELIPLLLSRRDQLP